MAVPTALNPLMVQDDQPLASQTNGLLPPVAFAAPPTQADAMDYNAQAVGNYVTQQRAQAQAQGLWDPATGMPTRAGAMDAANQLSGGLLMGSTAPGIRAFHGSPHSFDQFSLDKIGTGEGAQAYGHGLYFAGEEAVARHYRDQLTAGNAPLQVQLAQMKNRMTDLNQQIMSGKSGSPEVQAAYAELNNLADQHAALQQNPPPAGQGHMYEVNINAAPEHFLDWDKPLTQQPMHVQSSLQQSLSRLTPDERQGMTGADLYRKLAVEARYSHPAYAENLLPPADWMPPKGHASSVLKDAGIPGIRYLDGVSRDAGEGTSNTVVFDPATIEILRKYGIAGLMAGGAAAGSQQ